MNTIKINSLYSVFSERLKTKFKIQQIDNFIFSDFRLLSYEGLSFFEYIIHCKLPEKHIDMKILQRKKGEIINECNFRFQWKTDGRSFITSCEIFPAYDFNIAEYDTNRLGLHGLFCVWVMSYIMSEIENRGVKNAEKTTIPQTKYSREYKLSPETNRVYLLDDLIKYASDNYIKNAIHHEMVCPCWEVRGHYRHYKTGKVVFISAYKKGKQRNNLEPKAKEYFI